MAPPRSNLEESSLCHWKEWHNGDRRGKRLARPYLQLCFLANILCGRRILVLVVHTLAPKFQPFSLPNSLSYS